jgi:fumarate hydratase class II
MIDKQLWGGETAKAVANFPISGETVPVSVVRWLARVKGAAAAVNGELGLLDKRRVPDRLGHLHEHERQRGDRHACG